MSIATKESIACQLFDHLCNSRRTDFAVLLDDSHDYWDYVLNEWTDTQSNHYLLTKATDMGNYDMVKKILECGKICNVNVTISKENRFWKHCGSSSLIIACHNEDIETGKILLTHGANTNIIDGQGRTTFSIIASKNDVNFGKLLLNHGFNFNKLINYAKKKGYTAFHNCIINDSMDFLKFMIEMAQTKYNTKLELHNIVKPHSDNITGLILACDKNKNKEMVEYLLNQLNYCDSNDNTTVNKNETYQVLNELDTRRAHSIDFKDKHGRTAVWYAAKHGLLEIVKLLVNKRCNLGLLDHRGESALHVACREGRSDVVKWLINQKLSYCDINAYDDSYNSVIDYPPIISAITGENFECVKAICEYNGRIETLDHKSSESLEYAVQCGNMRILQLLLSTLIERSDACDFESLEDNCKFSVFSEIYINYLIDLSQKDECFGVRQLLINIKEKCILRNNFGLLIAFLDYGASNINQETIRNEYLNMQKNMIIATKLIKNIKMAAKNETQYINTLDIINMAINNMIENKDVVNDTLLFTANMIDSQKLKTNLNNALTDVLVTKNKEENMVNNNKNNNNNSARNQHWYKNVLLGSNIWCLQSSNNSIENNDNNDEKELEPLNVTTTNQLDQLAALKSPMKSMRDLFPRSIKGDNNNNNNNNKTNNNSKFNNTLYKHSTNSIIETKLSKLQAFLKNEIAKQNSVDKVNWHKLITLSNFDGIDGGYARQDSTIYKYTDKNTGKKPDLMLNHGTHPHYKQKQLFIDINTGFNGCDEYDYNAYLTNLLINAHRVNDQFQKDCKTILNRINSASNIKCKFSKAPVKAVERCKIKSATNYSDRKWPLCANLIDIIRCSVTFDTTKDLMAGLQRFEQHIELDDPTIMIKKVIRRKNTFRDICDRLDYSDIKLNVVVTYNNVSVIGEIQFLLSFMEQFKKQCHSTYRFIRKHDYFHTLNGLFYKNDSNSNEYKLITIIASKNMNEFEKLMLYCDVTKLGIDLNRLFLMLFDAIEWEKACILLWQCIKHETNEKYISIFLNNNIKYLIEKTSIKQWKKQLLINMVDDCDYTLVKYNGFSGNQLKTAIARLQQLD